MHSPVGVDAGQARREQVVELGDAQRAIRTVRRGAAEFGIKPDRIGIWGFSAGGHLASTAATHFDAGDANSSDPIERMSSRPDFAILCYPVISLSEFAHRGSRRNLLGDDYRRIGVGLHEGHFTQMFGR